MDFKVLSIGSNIGDRHQNLDKAKALLEERGVAVTRTSSIFESQPVGYTNQDEFLNQILLVETTQRPQELLETCLGIERHLGRIRSIKNGPRLIDIDILFYDDEMTSEDKLLIPHPRITDRRFILMPLAEIIPDQIHPIFDQSISELLEQCDDDNRVELSA